MSSVETQSQPPRSSRSVGDMVRSLVVVGVVVAVIIVLNYRSPEDPVKAIEPAPLAVGVAAVAPYPVYLPSDEGWRPTAARWEATPESAPERVWFVGGVYSDQGPFASLSQSAATGDRYLAEQVGDVDPAGFSTVDGEQWQRYETADQRSLVQVMPGASAIVAGTGSWEDLERFARSLRPVEAASG